MTDDCSFLPAMRHALCSMPSCPEACPHRGLCFTGAMLVALDSNRQQREYRDMSNEDSKHLDLLSTFHYVLGGITAFFSCIPFLHVFMGLAIISGKFFQSTNGGHEPPAAFGWLFVGVGAMAIIIGWSIAACMLIAAGKLRRHKSRMFCLVTAGLECIMMPFGTILGVFTIIALNKDSIKALFPQSGPPPLIPDPQAGQKV